MVNRTLHLEVDLELHATVDGTEMTGRLTGSGQDLELRVSDPTLLGGSGTTPARLLADRLAGLGVRLTVVADRELVTLGVPRSSALQRRITGSRHIRVASVPAALRLLRLRRAKATPLVPPPSPLPLLPTFLRRRRTPTTTHDPEHGGYPRLVVAPGPHPGPEDRRTVHHLTDRTVLGSAEGCDVVLAGLEPQHAEVRRTEADEFEVTALTAPSAVRVNGAPARVPVLLRTGSRLEVGPWTLVFAREEYADHGRPYGGRVGGEAGRQVPQPPRESL